MRYSLTYFVVLYFSALGVCGATIGSGDGSCGLCIPMSGRCTIIAGLLNDCSEALAATECKTWRAKVGIMLLLRETW